MLLRLLLGLGKLLHLAELVWKLRLRLRQRRLGILVCGLLGMEGWPRTTARPAYWGREGLQAGRRRRMLQVSRRVSACCRPIPGRGLLLGWARGAGQGRGRVGNSGMALAALLLLGLLQQLGVQVLRGETAGGMLLEVHDLALPGLFAHCAQLEVLDLRVKAGGGAG